MKRVLAVVLWAASSANAAGVVFSCSTEKHTIMVSQNSADSYMYQAWSKPKTVIDTPSMVVNKGVKNVMGTGPCRHAEYSFITGTTQYVVDNNTSCTETTPPPDATGQLFIYVNNKLKSQTWCTKQGY